jgi:WhiB family redox-sensing transcriptional regulator
MSRRSCRQCVQFKVSATRARNDFGDLRYKLARAQSQDNADRVARLVADVEAQRARILDAELVLEQHYAECTVIVSDDQSAQALTVAPAQVPETAEIEAPPSIRFAPQPWADEALCSQVDPEAFYPEKGGSTREAKRVCGRCTVAAECLTYALDHKEAFGIWGGMSERERRKLTRPAPTTTSHVTDDVA